MVSSVLASASIFVFGMMVPETSLVCILTFLIPLRALKKDLPLKSVFSAGLLWGCIAFGSLWWWIFWAFASYASSQKICLIWVALVMWCSLLSGLWLMALPRFPVAGTLFFFMVLTKYWLFFCAELEGFSLMSPLIPLAQYPFMLSGIWLVGEVGMMILLVGLQLSNHPCRYALVWLLISGVAEFQKNIADSIKPNINIIPIHWYRCGDPVWAGYQLAGSINKASRKDGSCLVGSESTFCWPINEFPEFVALWCSCAQGKPVILGAYENIGNKSHNGFFVLHNNQIVHRYFKQHQMPLVEKSTIFEGWLDKSFLGFDNIMKKSNMMPPGDCDHVVIDGKEYQIFICSELFFESKPVTSSFILLLWNDIWLEGYIKKLAMLYILYFEQKYRVQVVHIGTSGVCNVVS